MNQIARRSANGTANAITIPSALRIPALPASVASHMRAVEAHAAERTAFYAASPEDRERMFVGRAPTLAALRPHEREDAERAMRSIAEDCQPIALDAFKAWLGPVNAAVRNPQGAEDFMTRCLGLHALCCDLPHGCFTADARRALPEFFPSAADIRRAVEPGARRLRATRDALQAALDAKEREPIQPEAPQPVSPEQRAANLATLANLKAELSSVAGIAPDHRPTPRYLRPDHLAAARAALPPHLRPGQPVSPSQE